MTFELKLAELLTIIAILVGPIVAVWMTRHIDRKRDQQRRREEIFSTLMRTRPMKLSFDHVAALNLIQVEFYGATNVIEKYSAYIENLTLQIPTEENAQLAFFKRRDDKLYDLIHAIAQKLGYHLDKRDLETLSYGPIGWYKDDEENRTIKRLATELLQGRRPLPVWQLKMGGEGGPFPPPPQDQTPTVTAITSSVDKK